MSFLYSIASAFFINYFAMIIISYLPVRRKKLVTTIIISIADVVEIVIYAINIVGLFQHYDFEDAGLTIMLYLVEILAILIAYFSTMAILYSGVNLFKSRRLRKFESEASGKTSHFRLIFGIILLVIGVALAVLGAILVSNNVNDIILISGIVSIVVGVLGVALSLLLLVKNKKDDHKANIMLLVKENNNIKSFISNEKVSFSDAAPKVCDMYLLDDLGVLITDNKHFTVKGIRVDVFDDNLLTDSKLYEVNTIEFGEVLTKFEKFKKQKIVINSQKEIIKITNMK